MPEQELQELKGLKELIPVGSAKRINGALTARGAGKVSAGDEAIVAATEFHEQDATLAAGLVPVGTAAIGSILATSVTSGAWELTLIVTLGVSVVMFILSALINLDRRKNSVISRVINYRLENKVPLAGAGTAEATGKEHSRPNGSEKTGGAAQT